MDGVHFEPAFGRVQRQQVSRGAFLPHALGLRILTSRGCFTVTGSGIKTTCTMRRKFSGRCLVIRRRVS